MIIKLLLFLFSVILWAQDSTPTPAASGGWHLFQGDLARDGFIFGGGYSSANYTFGPRGNAIDARMGYALGAWISLFIQGRYSKGAGDLKYSWADHPDYISPVRIHSTIVTGNLRLYPLLGRWLFVGAGAGYHATRVTIKNYLYRENAYNLKAYSSGTALYGEIGWELTFWVFAIGVKASWTKVWSDGSFDTYVDNNRLAREDWPQHGPYESYHAGGEFTLLF